MNHRQPLICIKSLGCISNLLDGTGFERLAAEAGYDVTDNLSKADVILVNTCAFNQIKEDEAVRIITLAGKTKRRGTQLIVCGCLPSINQQRLRAIHDGVVFGPSDPSLLLAALRVHASRRIQFGGPLSYHQYSPLKKTIYQVKRTADALPLVGGLNLYRRLFAPFFVYARDVYCLKVVSGCCGTCAYCAIRFAKGRAKSKPLPDIQNEFAAALTQGYRRFVLVGDEITAYGRDVENGGTILDVIDLLNQEPQVSSVFLESFEPGFMIAHFPDILQIFNRGKVPIFCSSVQSGSNRILSLMNRKYQAEDYAACLDEIKASFPKVALRTEVMVGFPGETEEDFSATLMLIRRLNLDFVRAHIYEDRPNTPAAKMPGKIPEDVKRIRRKKIIRQHWKNLFFRGSGRKTLQGQNRLILNEPAGRITST
jgi:MiaB/RimO family radical SAM methylthiotransferase